MTQLTDREHHILIGTILGDAHIRKLRNDACVEFSHSVKQKDYLFWKYRIFRKWCGTKPHLTKIQDHRYNQEYRQWRFKTLSNSVFTEYWKTFYREGRKIVPEHIGKIITSPLSLAVWFMDDGGRRNDSYGLFLNTLSFTKLEHGYLRKCLAENFGIHSRIHWITDGYRLYIPSSEAKRFCTIISQYIIKIFLYKLSYNPLTTSFALLDRARDRSSKTSITRQSARVLERV